MKKKRGSKKRIIRKVRKKPARKKRRIYRRVIIPQTRITNIQPRVDKTIAENFVSLQRVMVNLTEKFDGLANQITKLLELFEVSAKSLAEREFQIEDISKENDKKIIENVDNLLDQNKVIAKSLALIHERNIEESPEMMPQRIQSMGESFQRSPIKQNIESETYERSISSEPSKFKQFPQ